MPEPVSTATATIRLPMSTPSGAVADRAAAGAIRVLPAVRAESQGACCGGACCAG